MAIMGAMWCLVIWVHVLAASAWLASPAMRHQLYCRHGSFIRNRHPHREPGGHYPPGGARPGVRAAGRCRGYPRHPPPAGPPGRQTPTAQLQRAQLEPAAARSAGCSGIGRRRSRNRRWFPRHQRPRRRCGSGGCGCRLSGGQRAGCVGGIGGPVRRRTSRRPLHVPGVPAPPKVTAHGDPHRRRAIRAHAGYIRGASPFEGHIDRHLRRAQRPAAGSVP